VPLVLLAIPSVLAGFMFIEPMAFSDYFKDVIYVSEEHDVLGQIGTIYEGKTGVSLVIAFMLHGMVAPPFWLAVGGIFLAWLFYIKKPELPGKIVNSVKPLYNVLVNKYGFDDFNQAVFANGTVKIGKFMSEFGDRMLIDGFFVNGTAKVVGAFSRMLKPLQSGLVYQYAFAMILGLLALMTWFLTMAKG
jgi:NADH-quinone oxidoreductase subunit L